MTDAIRKQLYTLLIVVAGGMALGRILCAEFLLEPSLHRDENNPDEKSKRKWPATRPRPMATFSSNDRSRWCTVWAIVDDGTFVIGKRDPSRKKEGNEYGDDGIVFKNGWQTVDRVMNPETGEFYSTKPPLLPVMMAGEYWVLKQVFGWTLTGKPDSNEAYDGSLRESRIFGWPVTENAEAIIRITLITFNWLPWIVYLILLSRLVERFGTSDWGRLFVVATACFGTLLTPFLISMNNHTLGACSALFSLYFASKVWTEERPGWSAFVGAGFFAAFTVANELPALAFAVGLFALMGVKDVRRTLTEFVPAALVPAVAFLMTNYLAMGEFTPTYEKFGGPWYRYEGSHWAKDPDPIKPGIDFARMKESAGAYAFNVLLGHHGVLSLTPYVFLSLAGMILASRGRKSAAIDRGLSPPARLQAWFALLTLGLTVVIIGFYLLKSDNYGGWTNGPRWLMWLTPFWLLTMLPVVDQLASTRWGRGLGYALLALSVMSMSYSLWNPWRHPWIYRWMDANGWIPY